MREIHLIVIHCSATREDVSYSPEQLERDHRARGFIGAGYNFYVRRSGEVVKLRPLEQAPAHVRGYNANSVGVCYEGGLDRSGQICDTRTPEQKDSLARLVQALSARFPDARICGHRDLSKDRNGDGRITPDEWEKHCPSFDAGKEYGGQTYERRD